jgi:hypothetical protein
MEERLRRAYDLLAEDVAGADTESCFASQAEALPSCVTAPRWKSKTATV